MGQLAAVYHSKRLHAAVRSWAIPVTIALLVLFGVHAVVKADPAPSSSELQVYLQNHELNPSEAVTGDFPQIFYRYNQQTVQLTSTSYIHLHPVSSGQYVAWVGIINGESQVFLCDVLNDSLVQLSSVSPNEGIYIHQNQVVWQGWDGQNWQIFYYDGSQVQQITNGSDSSYHAITDGKQIVYAEQLGIDDWKAQSYDIASGQVTTLRQGGTASTAYPSFDSSGNVQTAYVAQ